MAARAATVLGVDLELNGKRAIVTGGSKGIGLAVARGLATEGADVVLAARSAEPLEAAAAALAAETGRRALAVPTDTGDDDQVRELVRRTVAELGGVDILVNAAATPWSAGAPAGLADTTDEIVRREVEIKVLGYLRTARAVAPHLVAQRWGRIINISGLGARQANSIAQTVRFRADQEPRRRTRPRRCERDGRAPRPDPDRTPHPAARRAVRGIRDAGRGTGTGPRP